MKAVYRHLGWSALRGCGWILWAPVALALRLAQWWAIRPFLFGDSIVCRTCGSDIPIVGLYECGYCHYTWAGFYFARCEVCGDAPPYVECSRCGASTMNPLIFG